MTAREPFDTARPSADRLLAWPRVKDLTGLSRTTAWRLQRAGDFPQPVQVSPGRVGWRERDIVAWTDSRRPQAASSARRPGLSADRPIDRAPADPTPAKDGGRRDRPRTQTRTLAGQTSFEF